MVGFGCPEAMQALIYIIIITTSQLIGIFIVNLLNILNVAKTVVNGRFSTEKMESCSFLILFLLVLFCSLFAIYKVAPYKNSSSCYDDPKCIDFKSFLLQNRSSEIASHSILEFYPGNYSMDNIDLEHEIELTSLDNVTITSTEIGQRATINCSIED